MAVLWDTMQNYRNIMDPILYTKQLTDMSYAALDELGLIFDHILTSLKPLDQWDFKVRT